MKEASLKRQHTLWFHYDIPEMAKRWYSYKDQWLPGACGEGGGLNRWNATDFLGWGKLFCIVYCTYEYTDLAFIKTYRTLPRARHSGMWSQVGLRKHHYEQSWWRQWNSSWAISYPKRWCCESAALNMQANLENSAVATGLEKVSFHSNPKERQYQRMLKLLHNCTHLTR